ncbi:MAG: glycosyltransferase family 39 protein [Deltaproteobacteria bacterium]|nr:glycosyltransferase family 39 protein [Deltaproteobacteria bacterium]
METIAAEPTPDARAQPVEQSPSIVQIGSGFVAVIGATLLLLIAWLVLVSWGLGDVPFHTKGEPREGLVVWEMTHGGGWILPQRNGTELPSKPPLFHWLGALASIAHGKTDEWSIRFPSAALSLAGTFAVFAAGTALRNVTTGLPAALILMTTFEWARASTNARVDMTLTVGLEAAFLSLLFFWRTRSTTWLVPLYLGMSWAVLGKGPVGVALPGLTVVVLLALSWNGEAFRERRYRAVFDWTCLRQMKPLHGAVAVIAIAGSWYVMALLIGGWPFFRKQILAENVFTFLNNRHFDGGHRHGLFYQPLQLFLGLLPWSLLLPGLAVTLWQKRQELGRNDWRLYMLIWIAVVFSFFEVAASKRGVYLLSLYPAVALLLGWWLDEQRRAIVSQRWLAGSLAIIAWTATAVLLVTAVIVALECLGISPLALLQSRLKPKAAAGLELGRTVIRACGYRLTVLLTFAAIGLALSAQAARGSRWSNVFVALWSTTALALLTTRIVVMPAAAHELTLRDFMVHVRQVVEPTAEMSFYKTFDYQAVYYSQRHIPTHRDAWTAPGPRYLLIESSAWKEQPAEALSAYEHVPLADEGKLILLRRLSPPRG